MKVKYIGPHRALPGDEVEGVRPDVEIAKSGDWPGCWAEYGKPVEVPDEVGQGLIEQAGNWEAVAKAKKEG